MTITATNPRLGSTLLSLALSLLLLVILEIISTALVPALGLQHFLLLPFNVLLILFLAFRVQTALLPFLVLAIQVVHSVFSIESWSHGTLYGLTLCLCIGYLKNIIDFTTSASIVMITFVAILSWYLMTTVVLYFGTRNLDLAISHLWGSFPECPIAALISPGFFAILGRIWKVDLRNRVNA